MTGLRVVCSILAVSILVEAGLDKKVKHSTTAAEILKTTTATDVSDAVHSVVLQRRVGTWLQKGAPYRYQRCTINNQLRWGGGCCSVPQWELWAGPVQLCFLRDQTDRFTVNATGHGSYTVRVYPDDSWPGFFEGIPEGRNGCPYDCSLFSGSFSERCPCKVFNEYVTAEFTMAKKVQKMENMDEKPKPSTAVADSQEVITENVSPTTPVAADAREAEPSGFVLQRRVGTGFPYEPYYWYQRCTYNYSCGDRKVSCSAPPVGPLGPVNLSLTLSSWAHFTVDAGRYGGYSVLASSDIPRENMPRWRFGCPYDCKEFLGEFSKICPCNIFNEYVSMEPLGKTNMAQKLESKQLWAGTENIIV